MRKTAIALSFLLIAGAVAASVRQQSAKREQQAQEQVARGKYLVTILACNDCHTPLKMGPKGPEPDMSRFLSGHPEQVKLPAPPKLDRGPWMWAGDATNTAFAGPWGISYARNLTPEKLTGIGIWTEDMFMKSLRTGRHWGVGRPILPPMPWQAFGQMKDDDLRAIYAYLRTIKPVKNEVPDAVVAQ